MADTSSNEPNGKARRLTDRLPFRFGRNCDNFVAGWRSEKRFDGPHNDLWVGDWQTLGWGDINLDGRVNLRDALLLHNALEGAGAGGLDFALLGIGGTSVPEPATVVMLSGLILAGAAAWRRRRA